MTCFLNAENKLEFVIPNNEEIDMLISMSDRLCRVLKFPPGQQVTFYNFKSMDPVGGTKLTPEQGLILSKLLVLDTGTLTVSLQDVVSASTRGRPTQMMALLTAKENVSAMLQNINPAQEFPRDKHTIMFRIDRNSDRNKVIGLNWPVGATVNGVLVEDPTAQRK